MKAAARVFTIIGLICSIVLLNLGLIVVLISAIPSFREAAGESMSTLPIWISSFGAVYLIYGIYAFIWSILSLCAIGGHSKGFTIVAGIFYLPVSVLASIFMFCIRPDDLI